MPHAVRAWALQTLAEMFERSGEKKAEQTAVRTVSEEEEAPAAAAASPSISTGAAAASGTWEAPAANAAALEAALPPALASPQ